MLSIDGGPKLSLYQTVYESGKPQVREYVFALSRTAQEMHATLIAVEDLPGKSTWIAEVRPHGRAF